MRAWYTEMRLEEIVGEGWGTERRKVIVTSEELEWNSRGRVVCTGTGRQLQRRGRCARVCLMCNMDSNADRSVTRDLVRVGVRARIRVGSF